MQQIRVLLADDNERFGVMLSRFVSSYPDMDVVGVAADGREAMSMAESSQPDVVVMDLYMPDMDGFEATRLLTSAQPRTKVIALTANRSDDNRQRSLEAGAAAFIPKIDVDTDLIVAIRDLTDANRVEDECEPPAGTGESPVWGS